MSNGKTFRCIVDLYIKAVSAPGIRLPRKDRLYLSVFIFGQYKITKLVKRNLPLIFEEKFQFDKIFFDQKHSTDIININLKDQMVLIELIQKSPKNGAFQLATYCDSASSFLYPYFSLTPVYASSQRELLMTRSPEYTGISPKLEFQVNTQFYEEPLMSIKDSLEGLQDIIKSIPNEKWKTDSTTKKKFSEHESLLPFENGLSHPLYSQQKQTKSEWFSIEELDRDLTDFFQK